MFSKSMIAFAALMTFAPAARAQTWGTGMWGGMQGCSTPMKAGNGAASVSDDVREAREAVNELQRKLREKKQKLKKAEADVEKLRDSVTKTIDADFAEALFAHVESRKSCDEYKPEACAGDKCFAPYKRDEWDSICAGTKVGGLNAAAACGLPRSRSADRAGGSCADSLAKYGKKWAEASRLQRDVEKLEEQLEDRKDAVKTAEREARDRKSSEGGFCVECMMSQQRGGGVGAGGGGGMVANRGVDWAGVASNVGVGLLATYMGYQTNKMVAQNNSALGWPTQSYPAWGYGMPFFANGIYGALGGGTGQGSFGCGQTMAGGGNWNGAGGMGMMNPMTMMSSGYGLSGYGAGGVFGYPSSISGMGISGGMYLPGMSPWGVNGFGGSMNYGYGTGYVYNPYGSGTAYGYGTGYGVTYGTMVPSGLSTYGTTLPLGTAVPGTTLMGTGR